MGKPAVSLANRRRLPNASAQGRFYTIKEAAAIIGVHPWTMWDWIKNRKKNPPPSRRFGPTTIRIPKTKFHEWIGEQ